MTELETVQFGPGLRKFLGNHSEQGFPCSANQGGNMAFYQVCCDFFLAEDELLTPSIETFLIKKSHRASDGSSRP